MKEINTGQGILFEYKLVKYCYEQAKFTQK